MENLNNLKKVKNNETTFNGLEEHLKKAFYERDEREILKHYPAAFRKILKDVDHVLVPIEHLSPRSYSPEETEYILSRCPNVRKILSLKGVEVGLPMASS